MIVKFDTETLTEKERSILKEILSVPQRSTAPLTPCDLKGKKWIKIHGKGKQIVQEIVEYHESGVTATEIMNKVDLSEQTIRGFLRKLIKDKKVERSATRPFIYYKYGRNTDIQDALKNAGKVGVMG